MTQKNNITALIRQVRKIKAKYPDAIIWYRMGDYYQAFDDDAADTARELGTSMIGENHTITGFPHTALDHNLRTMVKLGYKVALCEQLEAPPAAKKPIKRKL